MINQNTPLTIHGMIHLSKALASHEDLSIEASAFWKGSLASWTYMKLRTLPVNKSLLDKLTPTSEVLHPLAPVSTSAPLLVVVCGTQIPITANLPADTSPIKAYFP